MVKRLRVFAGPNGSGKSSIIQSLLNLELEEGKKLDFGIYINADDIAFQLKNKGCPFYSFEVEVTKKELLKTASESGLINNTFSIESFQIVLGWSITY